MQDAYSLRCIPQVHGAARDTVGYVRSLLLTELNSANDNPLIFPDEFKVQSSKFKEEAEQPGTLNFEHGTILSGGNFHGASFGCGGHPGDRGVPA